MNFASFPPSSVDFVIETTSFAAFSSKGKASFYASASLFVNCLSFLFSGVV
jgi:hypothetical protein